MLGRWGQSREGGEPGKQTPEPQGARTGRQGPAMAAGGEHVAAETSSPDSSFLTLREHRFQQGSLGPGGEAATHPPQKASRRGFLTRRPHSGPFLHPVSISFHLVPKIPAPQPPKHTQFSKHPECLAGLR